MGSAFEWMVTLGLYLAWIVMALVALLALSRQKKSWPLLMQCVGAGGYFMFMVGRWLVLLILSKLGWYQTWEFAGHAFSFFLFVALALFTAGFCMEKLKQKGPAEAGFPVEAKKMG